MSVENETVPNSIKKPMNEAQNLIAGIYASGDKEAKQNWEDLEEFYNTLMTALVTANSETIKMLRTPGILQFIQDKASTKAAINGLDSDIKKFAEELNAIHDLHKGRVGLILTPDDLNRCFSIFELYMAFQTRYHSVIMPTVEMIADQCSAAARAISESVNQQEALQDLQDPTVVSDVAVKEVMTEPSPNTAVVIDTVNNSPTL